MEKKKIVIEKAVNLAGFSIIPIVEVGLKYSENNKGAFYFCYKRPLAIILSSKSGEKAIRITGEEIPLDQLIQDFPDIEIPEHILHKI